MTDVQFIDTALGRIRVQVSSGSGDAIVFWPSLLMAGDMWVRQADHFGARWRAILVDPPGHGGSQLRRSLTWDRGREMADHAVITTALSMPVFFCDPHSPWQLTLAARHQREHEPAAAPIPA